MSNSISFISVSEEDFPKVKPKAGFDMVKIGSVTRNKVSVFLGKIVHIPSIPLSLIESTFSTTNAEAVGLLHGYFTDARNAYVRERIIEGLNSIPAELLQFDKRNLWLAFNGISAEQAATFVSSVLQTRCEEFAFMAAAKKLGFASIEEVPEEKEAEFLAMQEKLLPGFLTAASSERNKNFLSDLVLEGRILSRYGKLSEAQIAEARKWIAGVDSPFVGQIESLLTQREKQIKEQIANVGLFGEGLDVMADYFKV